MPRILRSAARLPAKIIQPKRTSPRERGYDARWDRFSREYRRRFPFCAECLRAERTTFGHLVDHKYPVADGGAILPGEAGVWHLCRSHHGWKTDLEDYARRTGQMERIVMWCDEPELRPALRRGDLR